MLILHCLIIQERLMKFTCELICICTLAWALEASFSVKMACHRNSTMCNFCQLKHTNYVRLKKMARVSANNTTSLGALLFKLVKLYESRWYLYVRSPTYRLLPGSDHTMYTPYFVRLFTSYSGLPCCVENKGRQHSSRKTQTATKDLILLSRTQITGCKTSYCHICWILRT